MTMTQVRVAVASERSDAAGVAVSAGVSMNVRRWPGGARRPFLLVHGLSSNARLWDEVATVLSAAGHPADAVDLRSHGESDAPDDGYDTATAATDLAVLADALGRRDLVVAGQSWGGNVVVHLAARRPDLVAALALVDGGWIDLSTEFATWEQCVAALHPPELNGMTSDRLRALLATQHPDWSPAAVEATLGNLRELPGGALERRLPVDRHMQIVRSMWDDPPQPLYPRVGMPVLLLPALPKDEELTRKRRSRVAAAAAALPRATIREYEGADHDLHAQQPARLAADLLALASSLEDG